MAQGMCEPVVAAEPSAELEVMPEALIDRVIDKLVAHQRARVLQQAQAIDPRLCADDILQPDDYPALAGDARWNYEDGVLAGMQAVQMALRSELRRRG